MAEQPKLSIFSRIANPCDYVLENTADHIKIVVHAQNGELIPIYVSLKVAIQFAADVITTTLERNKGDIDKIKQDLTVLNQELQIVS